MRNFMNNLKNFFQFDKKPEFNTLVPASLPGPQTQGSSYRKGCRTVDFLKKKRRRKIAYRSRRVNRLREV